MVQRLCSWTAVKYIIISEFVLQFSSDNCIVVLEASPSGMEFVFLFQDVSLRATRFH